MYFGTGINGAQSDTTANSMSAGGQTAHSGLLQPMSMQSLLAMACMGQTSLNPTASSQTIPTAQLGPAATQLCMSNLFRFLIGRF